MKLAIITCDKLPNGVEDDQALFQSLANLGIEFDICIWNHDNDWSQYTACLLRSVWDYHEKIDAFTHWLNKTSTVTQIINAKEVILWNQNKAYLAELEQFGITIAPTTWISQQQNFDVASYCNSNSSSVFFLKPVIGADSSGTLRFNNTDEEMMLAQQHLDHWLSKVDMMLQPYIQTVETFGETSAIYFAGSLSHAVRKVPINRDYRVQDTFGAKDMLYHLNAAEMALAKATLDYLQNKFGSILYARFDFLHDQQGNVYLNEAELIEPSLFFNHEPFAAEKLAENILYLLTSVD